MLFFIASKWRTLLSECAILQNLNNQSLKLVIPFTDRLVARPGFNLIKRLHCSLHAGPLVLHVHTKTKLDEEFKHEFNNPR